MMSVPYLTGAEIEYVDTLQQSGFTINNSNAASTCTCGDSFHAPGTTGGPAGCRQLDRE